jgi:hypothetical protein
MTTRETLPNGTVILRDVPDWIADQLNAVPYEGTQEEFEQFARWMDAWGVRVKEA